MSANNKKLSNPAILVNNNPIAIIPNTCHYTEGMGEQKVEPTSSGGNQVTTVFAEDVASKISEVKFEVANTQTMIDLARQWKINDNNNAIAITSDSFSRTFANMSLTNNYEVGLGADTNLALEFHGDPAV